MNEEQFRKRFRRAIGEPPESDLERRLESILSAPPRRGLVTGLGSIAATLILLIAAGLLGWRLVSQRSTLPATVKPSPTTRPISAAVDPTSCRLAVVVMRESGPPGQIATEPGFVDTRTGQYTKDGAASIAGLPGGGFEGTDVKPSQPSAPVWYDEVAKRWLPVGPALVAPDGRSYVWVRLLPPGSNISDFKQAELHRHDLTSSADQRLWTYPGSIMVSRWDASGIIVDTVPPPPTGGLQLQWLIDPRTGAATRQPASNAPSGPTELPGDRRNGSFAWGSFGSDAQGHTLYRIGSRTPGDQEWIFYESAPGQRVTIYKGAQGDATGFDPFQAVGDKTGIWFSDYETHGIWHWDSRTSLKKIVVKGLPNQLPGPNSAVYVNPAGQCM
jgi:hypothetical protein